MNPLQYTSEEMFSSTELIRKSKLLFDKLHKNEIEKAIILRDGKPSFMLLDFTIYEKIMSEYIYLKELVEKENIKVEKTLIKKEEKVDDLEEIKFLDKKEFTRSDKFNLEELDEKDLEEALAEIDNLNLDDISNQGMVSTKKEDKEPLKEFWE